MLMLLLGIVASAEAQKSCVIADAETHVPIKEALIHTDKGQWARSDYRGYWTMKYAFDSAEVKRPGYLPTHVRFETLPDTLFLIPEAKQLKEVEVWGENQKSAQQMNEMVRKDAAQHGGSGPSGHDFLGFLDKRGNRDRRHLEEAQKRQKEQEKKERESKTWSDALKEAYEETNKKK